MSTATCEEMSTYAVEFKAVTPGPCANPDEWHIYDHYPVSQDPKAVLSYLARWPRYAFRVQP